MRIFLAAVAACSLFFAANSDAQTVAQPTPTVPPFASVADPGVDAIATITRASTRPVPGGDSDDDRTTVSIMYAPTDPAGHFYDPSLDTWYTEPGGGVSGAMITTLPGQGPLEPPSTSP